MAKKQLEDLISQEELNSIIEMYNNNISLREIEKRTSHGRPAITKMLERLGVKTSSGNHYRKYFFNFDFFSTIDNELSAYWLGFMYADGCVLPVNKYGEQEFKIQIAETDLELLEKFKEDIQSTYPIRYDDSKAKKNIGQRTCLQSLRSQKTVDDLKRLGCVEKKSLILTFPTSNQVPDEFIYHFIRGYFDGDGSISCYENKGCKEYHISFVGTEQFIKELHKKWLPFGSVLPDKRKTNSWYLNINGNKQITQIYHLLYDNATRYMERKYQKFQPLINKQ